MCLRISASSFPKMGKEKSVSEKKRERARERDHDSEAGNAKGFVTKAFLLP